MSVHDLFFEDTSEPRHQLLTALRGEMGQRRRRLLRVSVINDTTQGTENQGTDTVLKTLSVLSFLLSICLWFFLLIYPLKWWNKMEDWQLYSKWTCQFSLVQSLSCFWLFATQWTVACQVSLSITNSPSLRKLMSIELVMPSNHLILCHPHLLLPSKNM